MPGLPWILLAMLALSAALYFGAMRGMEGNRRRAYAYAGLVAFALLAAGIAGCASSSGGGGSKGRTVTLNATYPGDTNYLTSSGSATITVN
jgi:hypothetical protein